jgi:predicted secreted acid phosphatase
VLHGSIAHPNHSTAIAIIVEYAHFLTAHTQGSDQQNEHGNLVCHLHEQNTAAAQYVSKWKEIFAFQKQPFQLAANTQDSVKKKLKCSNKSVKIQHHI